ALVVAAVVAAPPLVAAVGPLALLLMALWVAPASLLEVAVVSGSVVAPLSEHAVASSSRAPVVRGRLLPGLGLEKGAGTARAFRRLGPTGRCAS
ncbi:MAG TPA: hypothetical protein VI197_21870, partial [Polyangiaceae bacterium]